MTNKNTDVKKSISISMVTRTAEKYTGLILMAACTYLYLESQIDAKPVLKASVAVAAVLLLVRSQFKKA